MPLADSVYVARRFQRSIRIDTDYQDPDALMDFICPASSAAVLTSMARHITETGQAAFTWTGPYGSGKSSLVIALSALTAKSKRQREEASHAVGHTTASSIWEAMPPGQQGWMTIPVVGQRASARKIIGDVLIQHGLLEKEPDAGWDDDTLVSSLLNAANALPGKSGILLFIDEMGKFLEAAARDGGDLYLFQQLAEIASRSNGKLVLVGILHQSFEEYAYRLSRDARDEWSKIHGRFVDLPVNTAGEEQIDLLSRAIKTEHDSGRISAKAQITADTIRQHKPGVSDHLERLLEDTWPLHPVVAALLGPISRRRFGQNQRSLFGFLNSAEPNGFQDFLHLADEDDTYRPDRLWDYLRINLEPAIIASPDGHRWAMAAEAIDRCEASSGSELHIDLLKTIAVLDLFRERSGLYPSYDLLKSSVPSSDPKIVDDALGDLRRWSLVIYRKHLSSFAIYAGSDFDIEAAIERALQDVRDVNFDTLHRMAGIQPVLAKRHYFRTGALRWFDVKLGSLTVVHSNATQFQPHQSTIGLYLLSLPTNGESEEEARESCRQASKKASKQNLEVIVGFPRQAWTIIDLAKELKALEKVQESTPEIQGDLIARREITSRLFALQNRLEAELQRAMLSAVWFENGEKLNTMAMRALNNKVSEVASRLYEYSPVLPNELLNRTLPSSSAIAAQNILLRAMANNRHLPRLGISGYPAEGGLFDSILGNTELHGEYNGHYDFQKPRLDDKANLHPAWQAAANFIENNASRSVSLAEIFEIWEDKPIGLKRGLMPILSVAFIQSYRNKLAFYREGIFQPDFTDLDADYLAKDPAAIQVRWMDLSHRAKGLLSGLAELVRDLDDQNPLTNLEPIDVGRGLVSIFFRLPKWSHNTQHISSTAKQIRTIFKHAHDPNQLLFSDLPGVYQKNADINDANVVREVIALVSDAMKELVKVYPAMLNRISTVLLSELHTPNDAPQSLQELRARAENIKQVSGEYRHEAFTSRLAVYDGSASSIEGIGSLAANKPPRDWVDADLDQALIEIASLSEKFIRTETYARVQGRKKTRHAMAVIVAKDGHQKPIEANFQITDSDRPKINALIKRLRESVAEESISHDIVLAALAELSSEFMTTSELTNYAEEDHDVTV
ncbi:hypothetical protein BDK62_12273 [Halomonas alkaliantarctica]|nr:hypothetical protein BDK62_12273 [Halomonas alkaliantarctica]